MSDDAKLLEAQDAPASAASSLPAMHCCVPSFPGQPRPAYSTVSSRVYPHVEMDSAPPNGAIGPTSSTNTARGPVKNTPYPLEHVPTPGSDSTPTDATSEALALPLGPSRDTIGPAGGGHAGVEVGVPEELRVAEPVDEPEAVCETEEEGDRVPVDDAVLLRVPVELTLRVLVCDGVPVCDGVNEALAVALGVGVPVCDNVDEELALTLELGVRVCDDDALPVALELGVPVCDDEALPVALELGVPVWDPEPVPERVGEREGVGEGERRLLMGTSRCRAVAAHTPASVASQLYVASSAPLVKSPLGTSAVTLAYSMHGAAAPGAAEGPRGSTPTANA